MNLDDLTQVWRSQDLSPLYGVDREVLHAVLRQEQARREKEQRRLRWFLYVSNALLLILAVLFFAILIDPNQPATFSARLGPWDYLVGGIGVAAAALLVAVQLSARRARQARAFGFSDSLRDHLRRRIAELDADVVSARRTEWLTVAMMAISAVAIHILAGRIKHEPVPWNEIIRPSVPSTVVILVFFYLIFFRWMPRERRENLARKRQLEALLQEVDGR